MKMKISLFSTSILLTLSNYAYADGTWVNCNRTNGYYQYFDSATIRPNGNDIQIGDVVGQWQTAAGPTSWSCSHRSNYTDLTVPMGVSAYPPYSAWGTTQVDGETYTIYNTVVAAGIGYIARWRYNIKGQTTDWIPLTSSPGIHQVPSQLFNINHDDTLPNWNIGADVQVRFVKTSTSFKTGQIPIFDPVYLRTYQKNNVNVSYGDGTYMIAQFRSGSINILPTAGTCKTSDVNVTLPPVDRNSFTHIGYTTGRTDFNINLTNCDAWLTSISYALTPITAVIDNNNGLFSIDNSSTASGIALQLLKSDDTPLLFNTNYFVSDYDPTQNYGNYIIPLRAGLYQTENTVKSGDINGSATFTITYK